MTEGRPSAAGRDRQISAEILKETETGSEVFNGASIFILFLMREQVRNGPVMTVCVNQCLRGCVFLQISRVLC